MDGPEKKQVLTSRSYCTHTPAPATVGPTQRHSVTFVLRPFFARPTPTQKPSNNKMNGEPLVNAVNILNYDTSPTPSKLAAAQKRKLCLNRQRTKKSQQLLKQQQILSTQIQNGDLQPFVGYPTYEQQMFYLSPFAPVTPVGFFPSPVICLPMVSMPPAPTPAPTQIKIAETREDKLERYRLKRNNRTFVRPKDPQRQQTAKMRRRESNGHFLPNLPADVGPSGAPKDFDGVSVEKASIRYILNI